MRLFLCLITICVCGCSAGSSDPVPPSDPAPLPDMSALKSQENGDGAVQTRAPVKP